MPKRTDISSILAIGAGLILAACGDSGTTSRSETTTVKEPATATVADCIERFSSGRDVWGDDKVRASFVYDISELGPDGLKQFWRESPDSDGQHSVTNQMGDGSEEALESFLKSDPKGDTEVFGTDDMSIIRINDAPAASFDEALRTGCERLRDGVTVRQVTFSQGNS